MRSWTKYLSETSSFEKWESNSTLCTVTAAMELKDACFFEKSNDSSRQCFKKQRHDFADKGLYSQNDFSTSHVWM